QECILSFLPLTHVFARSLHYGALAFGADIYFTTPERLAGDLKKIQPTIFATVPRLLEKVYGRILEQATTLTGLKKKLLDWALELAQQYELGTEPEGRYAAQLAVADQLVFTKWRAALGGHIKYVICGGAALNAQLANLYAAAGVTVLQGYGLTETSPVITYNRPGQNRAGTVGQPLPGVEVRIAADGEILTRGPHVMQGYYKNPEKTAAVIDEEGWFCTGDIGEVTEDGFLRITDRKKDLFKLSTGKYVMPQPLENHLSTHPLIDQAVVVGTGHKYCTALIFPNHETLRVYAEVHHLGHQQPMEVLAADPGIHQRYQALVDEANLGKDAWSTIKRFRLLTEPLTVENGLLTPTLKVRRTQVRERYAAEIDQLYADSTSPSEAQPTAA
ncbi:MAG: AMP-binding protein, partial [Bacteroidota bacterium]